CRAVRRVLEGPQGRGHPVPARGSPGSGDLRPAGHVDEWLAGRLHGASHQLVFRDPVEACRGSAERCEASCRGESVMARYAIMAQPADPDAARWPPSEVTAVVVV